MNEPFGPAYAGAYDLLYAAKDYGAECDLLERLFREEARRPVRRLLDLGCGTGGHARPLAARGYEVVGVDRSAPMLERARAKGAEGNPRFVAGDVRSVRLGGTFDAVLILFAVLGYQESDADVAAALETARVHAVPGGLLVFDYWNGVAVEADSPRESLAERLFPGGDVLRRRGAPRLDPDRRVCEMRYAVETVRGGTVVDRHEEAHRMRYFFPDELRSFLARAGFETVRIGAFPAIDRPADASAWEAIAVARVT